MYTGTLVNGTDPFFNDYHSYDDIMAWMTNLAAQYPTVMDVQSFGKSYQGNDLKRARLTLGARGVKPVIYWEGGIHAREWIAHATMCYMISKLATLSTLDATVEKLLNTYEFHIVPVVNPDGYEYTWDPKGDRMWLDFINLSPSCL